MRSRCPERPVVIHQIVKPRSRYISERIRRKLVVGIHVNQDSQQSDVENDRSGSGEEIASESSPVTAAQKRFNPQKPTIERVQIVLPLHNEAQNIKTVTLSVIQALRDNGYLPKILLVNDGSTDGSHLVISQLAQQHPEIAYISFSRNFGKEAALMAGIHECGDEFDILAYMDSDGQHTPDGLLQLLARASESEADLVCGARSDRSYQTPVQRWASRCFYRVFHAMSRERIDEGVGDFNALRPKVVFALRELREDHLFMKGLVSWIGFRKEIVPIEVQPRRGGQPKSSTAKMLKLALGAILSFSAWPLRAWSVVGIVSSLVALIYLVFVVVKTVVYGADVPGYATTIVLLLGLGGLQIFSIGVLGEYIGRIYDASKRRPRYIIAERSDD